MATLLFTGLICILIHVDGRVASDPQAVSLITDKHQSTSLLYVYAFFRHGIRSPLYKPYPKDPNKSKYHEYFPGPAGSLTKIGKEMMYKTGKKLRARYQDFVSEYTVEEVRASSTNTTRTMMSALCVMAGLFPPSKQIFKDLKWQPIPIWQNTEDFDKAYIYNDDNFPKLGLQICPQYGKLINEGYTKITEPDSTKGRHKLYELLQIYTGKGDVNSINTLYEVWDTLQFESLNELPLPDWAIKPQSNYHNKPLYPELMAPIMVEWFKDTEYLNKNKDMLSFYSGPVFNSIHYFLQGKAQRPHSAGKLRFHSTHDTTLFVLIWALQLEEPKTIGPGDGVLFELHEENNTPIVKIIYYDANKGNFKELIPPQCLPPCSLQQFIKVTPGLTPQQWQERCLL